jgi:hypothetical protein
MHTMANIFQNWNEAREAARTAQGPITGWIEFNRHGEPDRLTPIVCGARSGEVTGPSTQTARW